MRLDRLLEASGAAATVHGDPAVEVTAVTHDSRAAVAGSLFCCVPGERADGHDFAPTAVDAGAVALLCERDLDLAATRAVVPSTREAMGPLAAAFHGNPSRALSVVGVTGTNGKTTTCHLLRSVLEADGRRTGVIGTLTGARTTPEATDLQATLAGMRDDGDTAVAMEVSSHALALHRVDGTWFAVAVFTNLSRDHLDFHTDLDGYFEAKARLFTPGFCGAAVIDVDGRYGRELAERTEAAGIPTTRYRAGDADDLVLGAAGSTFRWHGASVQLGLGGRFNVANALAAAEAAALLGVADDVVAAGLAAAGPVPGRFEVVDAGQPFAVVVDYAHTPDGLEHVLASAREVAGDHKVVVVFGCGGDRDRTKRPAMGDVASRLADVVVLTSDNPRSEDPDTIIGEVAAGMGALGVVTIQPDRRAAIAVGLDAARRGDIVVVAGKGHETTQTIGDTVAPFDDREVVREELAALRRRVRW
jgi:UDP-N-acetylmuramoyl-L-alanyl-D-glutamate--2,6-diaminopimelate ligase